jgi:hypothetical protein
MQLILDFIAQELIGLLCHGIVEMVRLTWQGFVCGVAAMLVLRTLPFGYRHWPIPVWVFLITWACVTAAKLVWPSRRRKCGRPGAPSAVSSRSNETGKAGL